MYFYHYSQYSTYFILAETPNLVVYLTFQNSTGLTVFDNSGSNNNAQMSGAITLSPHDGKCGAGAIFFGGKLLFDPTTFHTRPKVAITIALWVKLDHIAGSVSVFGVDHDVTGHGGTLFLKVTAGMVQWTHIDEHQNLVFDIDSGTFPVVSAGQWIHIAATYDSGINSTNLIVSGRLINEKEGQGYISKYRYSSATCI